MRNTLLIVLTITCLAGCTMIPAYLRPAPPIPAEWPAGPAYNNRGSAPPPSAKPRTGVPGSYGAGAAPLAADVGWRGFYADERLQKVIALALGNNRDLRVAALNIEKARSFYRIQRAALFPEVDASGGLNAEKYPPFLSPTGKTITLRYYNAGLGITSWEIDFFGRLRSLKASALEQYLATGQALRSARIALMAEVASMYLTYAADRENLKLSQSTLAARQATYNLIQRRFDVGASSALDLRQAQTTVESARVDAAGYIRLLALDENALNLLAGIPVPAGLLPEELDSVTPPKDISPGLASDHLLRRPDILQAENQLESSQRQHWRRAGKLVPPHRPHYRRRNEQHGAIRSVRRRFRCLDFRSGHHPADLRCRLKVGESSGGKGRPRHISRPI